MESKKFDDGSSFAGFDGVNCLPVHVDGHSPLIELDTNCPIVHKRKPKPVRKVALPLMVVGEDITLNDIVLTNALTLVGRFGGRKVSPDGVKKWVLGTWSNITCLDMFLLPKGWLAFKFKSEADAASILPGVWRWNHSGLLLKSWSPLFDPRHERYDLMPI